MSLVRIRYIGKHQAEMVVEVPKEKAEALAALGDWIYLDREPTKRKKEENKKVEISEEGKDDLEITKKER